jgi:ribosomal protein L14
MCRRDEEEETSCQDRSVVPDLDSDYLLTASAGDRIIVVVQKQRSFGEGSAGGLSISNKVRRGDIRHAVVVRARKEEQRKDGSLIRFDDNACVLINKNGDPIGSRLTSMTPHPSVTAHLTESQASLEPNYETNNGRRSSLSHRCMYK